MTSLPPDEITGVSAGGRHQLPGQTRWTDPASARGFGACDRMRWKIGIGTFLLLAVGVVVYQFGYHAAVPDDIASKDRNNCISYLKMLDIAKQEWARDNGSPTTNAPTWQDLDPHLAYIHGKFHCPSGGSYTIGRREVAPTCSFPGHRIPSP